MRRRLSRSCLAALSLAALSPVLTGCGGELFWGVSTIYTSLLYLDIGMIPVRAFLGQVALSIFNGTFP